jgi:endo-1,3-1,4-beta-glycanase ExoK
MSSVHKYLHPLLLLLPLVSFAACEESELEENLPCYLSFVAPKTASGAVLINNLEYTFNPADSSLSFGIAVRRTNMQNDAAIPVRIEVTEEATSADPFPTGLLNYPAETMLERGMLQKELSFSLNLGMISNNDIRNSFFGLGLSLRGEGDVGPDAETGSIRLLVNMSELLKELGIYYRWKLDFFDDFEGTGPAEGYNVEWWGQTSSAGHGGIGYRRPETISRKDGILVCSTYRSPSYGDAILSSHMYHKKNYLHARFEFRVKVDIDPYGCVGGVVLTWPHNEGSWPRDGEMDMYETFGNSPNALTFIHYGTPNTSGGWSDNQISMRHPIIRDEWHTMAVDWTAEELRIYRDNRLVWTITDKKAIPSVPHYFVIQSGPNNESLPAGARIDFCVDWVKIYIPSE